MSVGSDTNIPRLTDTISGVLVNGRMQDFFVLWAEGGVKENEHAWMSLYVSSATKVTDFTVLPGQRIEFDFGTRGNSMKFQGYVAAVTPHHRLQGDHVVDEQEIHCLGESMVFKGNHPRFFTDVTCTQAIARIVAESNIGFSDEFRRDETVWRALAQTDETDWQEIILLAGRIGACVLCQRGVVRLLDYQDIMYRTMPTRIYTTEQALPLYTVDMTSSNGILLDFTPTNQSPDNPLYTKSSMAYMVSGQAVELPAPSKTTGRFSITAYATDMPARTVQEAQTLQDGYYIPPWVQAAEVRVMGDATVTPAVNISIVSRGGTPNFDGVWYVKEVSHQVNAKAFTTTLQVGRADRLLTNWRSARPFWLGDKRGVPELFPAGTGRWLSTWRQSL